MFSQYESYLKRLATMAFGEVAVRFSSRYHYFEILGPPATQKSTNFGQIWMKLKHTWSNSQKVLYFIHNIYRFVSRLEYVKLPLLKYSIFYLVLKIAPESLMSVTQISVIFSWLFYRDAAVYFKSKIISRWLIVLLSKSSLFKIGI